MLLLLLCHNFYRHALDINCILFLCFLYTLVQLLIIENLKKSDPEEQNLAVACKVLIQNSIVLWNYLYLSEIITNCKDEEEQKEALSMIKEGSILCWGHINLHGEFNFKNMASNDHSFNLTKILNLKFN